MIGNGTDDSVDTENDVGGDEYEDLQRGVSRDGADMTQEEQYHNEQQNLHQNQSGEEGQNSMWDGPGDDGGSVVDLAMIPPYENYVNAALASPSVAPTAGEEREGGDVAPETYTSSDNHLILGEDTTDMETASLSSDIMNPGMAAGVAGLLKGLTPATTVDHDDEQGQDEGASGEASGISSVPGMASRTSNGGDDANPNDPPAIENNHSSGSTNSDPNKSFFLNRFSKWRKSVDQAVNLSNPPAIMTSWRATAGGVGGAAGGVVGTGTLQFSSWRAAGVGNTNSGGNAAPNINAKIPALTKAQPITQATLSPGSVNAASGEEDDDNHNVIDPKHSRSVDSSEGGLSSCASGESSSSDYSTSSGACSAGKDDPTVSTNVTSSATRATRAATSAGSGSGSGGSSTVSGVSALQWAAATVVDSVQAGYFRGRYQYEQRHKHNNKMAIVTDEQHESGETDEATAEQLNNSTAGNPNAPPPPSPPPRIHTDAEPTPLVPASHTYRILQSPHSLHVQKLMQGLQSHEYIMLLGKGMLGVNLKQAYLKESGVFVDYLVSRGAADQSKIIHAGDQLLMIGDVDVRRGTIQQVPQQIAIAKRPVRLIWATGSLPGVAQLDAMHVAVALLHTLHNAVHSPRGGGVTGPANSPTRARAQAKRRRQHRGNRSRADSTSSSHRLGNNSDGKTEAEEDTITPTENAASSQDEKKSDAGMDNECDNGGLNSSGSLEAETGAEPITKDSGNADSDHYAADDDCGEDDNSVEDDSEEEAHDSLKQISIPLLCTIDDFCNPPLPPTRARQAYHPHSAKRNNERFSVSLVVQAALIDPNVRAAFRHAFLLCAADGRRFPFLARHFSQQEDAAANRLLKRVGSNTPKFATAVPGKQHEQSFIEPSTSGNSAANSPNALLMMYLELLNFVDFYGVMPPVRRRQNAQRIAHKFFLPTRLGNEFIPPMFDFHTIVPDKSLRSLEAQLGNSSEGCDISRDIFWDFQVAAVEILSRDAFVRFLVSADCARMRAYLRNTAPYVNLPLHDAIEAVTHHSPHHDARNYFCYMLAYLLSSYNKEGYGEHDELILGGDAVRNEHAASGLCAALVIRGKLFPALQIASKGDCNGANLLQVLEQVWESFIAPYVGALHSAPLSKEAEDNLKRLRAAFEDLRRAYSTPVSDCEEEPMQQRVNRVVQTALEGPLLEQATLLADELVYSYATNVHPRFREHKFHEWLCQEFVKARFNPGCEDEEKKDESSDTSSVHSNHDCDHEAGSSSLPHLPVGCVKRLLQKAEFPAGVAPHKPSHRKSISTTSAAKSNGINSLGQLNADCALVFGTTVGLDLASQMPSPALDDMDLRRYACHSVRLMNSDDELESTTRVPGEQNGDDALTPELVPPTLESYAVVPPATSQKRPFTSYHDSSWISSDGWEISLVNFLVPRADSSSSSSSGDLEDEEMAAVYGVSLVFRATASTNFVNDVARTELISKGEKSIDDLSSDDLPNSNVSIVEGEKLSVRVSVGSSSPTFNEKMSERTWTERVATEVRQDDTPVTIGLCLLSHRNVIIAMRDTLVKTLHTFCLSRDNRKNTGNCSNLECNALVNILGNFSHQEVEPEALRSILYPFIRNAVSPWVERPLHMQKQEFEQQAGNYLLQSLPPVPLALMFVTALLEQKIVFASSRRSVLLSATTALTKMLKPFKWCHLLVPRVPSALASDLLQYPAPFILGLPSEDPEMTELIRDLPEDVTLVDLDVGRVILAPLFAHQSELGRGVQNSASTARELRAQVLYLAQCLGGVFGNAMDPETWSCDRPLTSTGASSMKNSRFDVLCGVCNDFLQELVAGTASCCYWIEESCASGLSGASSRHTEPTILLDEDRFFYVKCARHRYGFKSLFNRCESFPGDRNKLQEGKKVSALALGLDDFDLVLEAFLRCQSMNAYIGNCDKKNMAFY